MPTKKDQPTIFVAADHRGRKLANWLIDQLKQLGYQVTEIGKQDQRPSDDFPVFAHQVVAKMLAQGEQARGILLCGSGQGMAIAANRFKGIRAVVVQTPAQAKLTRNDDDSNVLALPADELQKTPSKALEIVEIWLRTPFEAIPRRQRRLKQLDTH